MATRRDALGRFPPGVSGNPGGRPANTLYTVTLRKLRETMPDSECTEHPEGITRLEAVADKVVSMLLAGDANALAAIMDRETPKVLKHEDVTDTSEVDRLIREMRETPEGRERLELAKARALENVEGGEVESEEAVH